MRLAMQAGPTGDMHSLLAVLGAAGGLTVFAGGCWAIVRGIIRQTDATRENTDAVVKLTGKVETLATHVNDNTQRIVRLESRRRRWLASR